MGDQRDPERDQPLPKPGQVNVQEVLRRALTEREEYGRRKYGTPLQTDNGRDALTDAWEEALDLVTYLTQMRLERGDVLPGMDPPVPIREGDPAYNDLQDYLEGDSRTQDAAAKRLDQRAVTEGQLAPMTYHERWGELPDLKGRS